jgi:hypothetical protein
MKSLKINLLFFLILISHISCTDEDNLDCKVLSPVESYSVPIVDISYSIEELAENSNDFEDERINSELLKIAQEMKCFVNTAEFKKSLRDNISLSREKSLNFSQLSAILKDTSLYDGLRGVLNSIDLNYYRIGHNKTIVETSYTPVIYIPNLEIADFEKSIILSLGFEVNNELPGMEDLENHIFAWVYDEEGLVQETLINEELAMSTTQPILIITNANNDISSEGKLVVLDDRMPVFETDINNKSTAASVQKTIDKYKINFRYENDNKSEYSYKLRYHFNDNTSQDGGYRTEIREIHKDDVGSMFEDDFDIWQIDYFTGMVSFSIVTFEYDWYAGAKAVWVNDDILYCRMKYAHEYYQKFKCTLSAASSYSAAKGYLKIVTK